LTKK
jgi:gas vesicle protein